MPGHPAQQIEGELWRNDFFSVVGADDVADFRSKGQLRNVALLKTDGECLDLRIHVPRRKCRDETRVDSTTQKTAEWHIAADINPERLVEFSLQQLEGLSLAALCDLSVKLPVFLFLHHRFPSIDL